VIKRIPHNPAVIHSDIRNKRENTAPLNMDESQKTGCAKKPDPQIEHTA
jgi:hypothetical protein